MAGIEWLSSFETGIGEIDNDHRGLVDKISNIQGALDSGDMNLCQSLFQTFLEQAQDHFRREEAFLGSIDFPHVESHAASHNHLLDLIGNTIQSMKSETDADTIRTHLEDITYYLLEDVIKADAEFKSYVREFNLR